MEPKYLAGPEAVRMAQHFEALNDEAMRVDWYLRAIHWARVAVVLAIVAAAAWLAVRGIEKAAYDAAHYGEMK